MLIVLFIVFLTFTGPPQAITKMYIVREGMSKEEVYRILGEPQKSFNGQIVYRRFLSPGFMSVYFDKEEKYTGIWDYEPY